VKTSEPHKSLPAQKRVERHRSALAISASVAVMLFLLSAIVAGAAAASAVRYEQADTRLAYAGTWKTNSSATAASGGSFCYADSAGASVTVRFTGTAFAWIAKKSPVYGIARLTLDGSAPTTVDLYHAAEIWQQTVWQTSGLTNTTHTLVIEWTGSKNAAATDYNIGIDAFEIVGTLEQAGPGSAPVPRAPFAAVYADKTRVTFDLATPPSSVMASCSVEGVLTIDCTGVSLPAAVSLPVGSPEIDSLSAAPVGGGGISAAVRLVLDLARYQGFRVMSLPSSSGSCPRIVVDVWKRTAGPDGAGPPLVCIDAGHGGHDPGAIGASGSYEKDLNLALALAVAENLRARGLRVMMTRSTDVFVELQTRADLANAAGATLFLSIHNNAYTDPSANGTETYYKGTSTSYSVEGRAFAEAVQRQLVAAVGFADRGARTHPSSLVVLNRPVMTTALTEVAFITNPAEEAKILNPAVQQAATWGIVNGILEHLRWSTKVYTSETVSSSDYTSQVAYAALRGADRYDTAIRVSQAAFPSTLPQGSGLVLAPGDTFAEALCAGPLASAYGGPVLLTPSVGLNNAVRAEMVRLAPQHVLCVGLSASVVDEIRAAVGAGTTVTALNGAGGSVYDMSYRVAAALRAKVGDLTGATAVITRGDVFPDAISVSPLACAMRWPILLTDGPTGTLNGKAAAALVESGIAKALKVGTYAVLPSGVTGVANLSGRDRYATNRNVAVWAVSNSGLTFAHTALATGDKFPDALAAGPYLALNRGVLLLSPLLGPVPTVISDVLSANALGVQRLSFIACVEPVIGRVQALLP